MIAYYEEEEVEEPRQVVIVQLLTCLVSTRSYLLPLCFYPATGIPVVGVPPTTSTSSSHMICLQCKWSSIWDQTGCAVAWCQPNPIISHCVSIRPPEYHPQQVLPCHRHRLSCHRALCLKAMIINFAMGTKYYFLHCASILQLPTTSFCSSSSNATFSCIVLEAAYVWLLPMGGQHKVDYTQ